MSRIERRFARLKKDGRAGLVTFITAGDPDFATSRDILLGLPAAGADIIELGMPFSDPMADGPAIQASSQRALKSGATMSRTLDLVAELRRVDAETPVVLMGYFNPIHALGCEPFCEAAAAAGVDGLIVVDLPPEESGELTAPARAHGIDFVMLAAPTTGDKRLARVTGAASGFVYHVAVTGVTGTRSAETASIARNVARIRATTDLPVAVGFGIKTPTDAAAVAELADAVVVGSAITQRIARAVEQGDAATPATVADVLSFVGALAGGVRAAGRVS